MRETTSGAAHLTAAGDLSTNAAAFARNLRANIAPSTTRTYSKAVATVGRVLVYLGLPIEVAAIAREHAEAFARHR